MHQASVVTSGLAHVVNRIRKTGAGFSIFDRRSVAIAFRSGIKSLALTISLIVAAPTMADVRHDYDEAGRLVQTVAPNGDSAQYEYDAAGNTLAITRRTVSQVAIVQFTPSSGAVGTVVTISGSGFSATANQNSVSFNGVAATVNSADANRLVVTVPAGATSGPISVTTPNGSATTASAFTVVTTSNAPTIIDFNPKIGTVDTAFTITGTNFDPILTNDKVTLNVGRVALSASTSNPPTILGGTVPLETGSGKIGITTLYGTATSTADFIVVPSYGALGIANEADIVVRGRITVGGPAQSLSLPVGKSGVLLFDGAAGNVLSIDIPTWAAGTSRWYRVYTPRNELLKVGAVQSTGNITGPMSIHLPTLPLTGTYSIYFSTGTGAANFDISLFSVTELLLDNPPLNMAFSQSWKTLQFKFNATAGQKMGLGFANLAFAQSTGMTVTIYRPDGTILSLNGASGFCPVSQGGCSYNFSDQPLLDRTIYLPETGTYRAVFAPNTASTGSFSALLTSDATGSPPFFLNTARAGQNGRFGFTSQAGGSYNVIVNNIDVTSPLSSSAYVVGIYIVAPDGSLVMNGSFKNATAIGSFTVPPLPVTGNYTVLVDYYSTVTGSMFTKVEPDAGGEMSVGGNSTTASLSAGQKATFTFIGYAGRNYGVGVTGLTLTPSTPGTVSMVAYSPSGSQLATGTCNISGSGCGMNLPNVPETGMYRIVMTPASYATGSFYARTTQDLAGTLTAGTPYNLNLPSAGLNARLTFNGNAGDNFNLSLAEVALTGPGSGLNGNVTIYKPDGTSLISQSFSPTATTVVTMPALPTTGTYTVFIDPPSASSGTMKVRLSGDATATLALNGTPSDLTITQLGQKASLTFSGTAGQNLGLGISSLTLAPTSSTQASVNVYKPDGTVLTNVNCVVANGGCGLNLTSLPVTGEYRVVVLPASGGTGSFTATLSSDLTGSLVAGAAYNFATTRAGQNGRLTLNLTAGQNRTLTFSSLSTIPIGRNVLFTVYKPDGTQYASTGTSQSSSTLNLTSPPVTGTYTLVIDPYYASTVTVNITLSP